MDSTPDHSNPSHQGRFTPGDHLSVRRSGYTHHGVYSNDDRIIQFGGGIPDKPTATITVATLAEFERGVTAKAVRHGQEKRFWLGPPPLPPVDATEKIIERAEWLLANHTPKRYNLIGNNCEHMANWCVTGWYTESHQVRTYLLVHALITGTLWLLAVRLPRSPVVRIRTLRTIAAFGLSGVGAIAVYNFHIRKFWQTVGLEWRAHERELADKATSPDEEGAAGQ